MQFKSTVENIDVYMKSIEQYPRLTHEQERELAWRIHNSPTEDAKIAKDWLISCNLRLAVMLAHQYKKYHNSLSDLVQEANVGLCTAADKFDPDRCPKFSLVASFWCKLHLRKFLASQTRTVVMPVAAAQLAAKVAKTRNAIIAKTGVEPTDEELSSTLGISLDRLKGAYTADIGVCSMDDKVNPDSETTFLDMLDNTDNSDADTAMDTVKKIEQMLDSMQTLSDRDRFLLRYTYGIGCKPVSQDVLATETGWDKRRIHGRVCSLLKRLREHVAID